MPWRPASLLGDGGDGLGQLSTCSPGFWHRAAISFAAVQFPRLAPALKMGVAYPLSNRFRTGMTIAMFSLIIFSLTVFSAVNANFSALRRGEDGARRLGRRDDGQRAPVR